MPGSSSWMPYALQGVKELLLLMMIVMMKSRWRIKYGWVKTKVAYILQFSRLEDRDGNTQISLKRCSECKIWGCRSSAAEDSSLLRRYIDHRLANKNWHFEGWQRHHLKVHATEEAWNWTARIWRWNSLIVSKHARALRNTSEHLIFQVVEI